MLAYSIWNLFNKVIEQFNQQLLIEHNNWMNTELKVAKKI